MNEGSPASGRFLDGMKFGFGFAIPFVALLVGALALFVAAYTHSILQLRDSLEKTFGPEAALQILRHEPDERGSNLRVRGRVRNGGSDTWDYVRLQVDLLDEGGRFVGLCEGRCSGPLHPGEERNFSVDCKASAGEPLPRHKSYTIEVVDASFRWARESKHDGA